MMWVYLEICFQPTRQLSKDSNFGCSDWDVPYFCPRHSKCYLQSLFFNFILSPPCENMCRDCDVANVGSWVWLQFPSFTCLWERKKEGLGRRTWVLCYQSCCSSLGDTTFYWFFFMLPFTSNGRSKAAYNIELLYRSNQDKTLYKNKTSYYKLKTIKNPAKTLKHAHAHTHTPERHMRVS